MTVRIVIGVLAAILAGQARSENWPQFRGPAGDGRSRETNVPVAWSNSEGIRWKKPIVGEGHSSPVVWGNSVFLTSALPDGPRMVMRLNADDGKVVWTLPVALAPRESMHRENSPASSTPVTDGERVVTSFQTGQRVDLRCYDFSGKELWAVQPLEFAGEHGYSYSPIIYKDLVIFDCRQEGEAATLALDKNNGRVRWRTTPGRKRISHVTPLIINDGQREQLIVSGSDETRSYNPATGREYWRCDGPSDVSVAGLVYGDGLVFATAGYPARTRMAIKTAGRGDVTKTDVVWKLSRQVTYVPSPVYYEGHLYTVVDDGLLYCFDAKTGEVKWEERLGGRHRASLLLAEGRIYATNDKGKTTIFRASSDQFQKLAENDLAEFCYATPAISGGRIYLRTGEHLYCIQSGAQ